MIAPDALNIPIASLISMSELTISRTITLIYIDTIASGTELLGMLGTIETPIIRFYTSPVCNVVILVWY